MKNTFKIIGIIAFCSVIGISLITFGSDDGTTEDPPPTTHPNPNPNPNPNEPDPNHQYLYGWYSARAVTESTNGSEERNCTNPAHIYELPESRTIYATGTIGLFKAAESGIAFVEIGSALGDNGAGIVIPAYYLTLPNPYPPKAYPNNSSLTWVPVRTIGDPSKTQGGFFQSTPTIDGQLIIPSTVWYILKEAFKDQAGITGIEFKENGGPAFCNVKEIGDRAFSGCAEIADKISFEKGLVKIGEGAFEGCVKIGEIVIPSTVTDVGIGAFTGYTGLLTINGFSKAGNSYESKLRAVDAKWGREWRNGLVGTSGVDDPDPDAPVGTILPEEGKQIVFSGD
jgi:hypothetical protein